MIRGAIKLSARRGMHELLALAYVTKVVTPHLILLTGDGFGGKNFRHSKNVLHPNPNIKKGLDLN